MKTDMLSAAIALFTILILLKFKKVQVPIGTTVISQQSQISPKSLYSFELLRIQVPWHAKAQMV
jgi:hypothetical protein